MHCRRQSLLHPAFVYVGRSACAATLCHARARAFSRRVRDGCINIKGAAKPEYSDEECEQKREYDRGFRNLRSRRTANRFAKSGEF